MTLKCAVSDKVFTLSEQDQAFYRRLGVPTPRLCPEERLRRRLAFRNERVLYKRTCDSCSSSIISIYSEDKPFPVYCGECWWGDTWNAETFGLNIDFSKPFFQQVKKLQRATPRLYMFATNNENSDYTNGSAYNRNCYMTFVSDHNEASHYCYSTFECRSSLELMNAKNCELCYDCVGCVDCYDVAFSVNCSSCHSSRFIHNCRSCSDCVLCTNLRNNQYCFNNEQLSKEDYLSKLENLNLHKRAGVTRGRRLFADMLSGAVEPSYVGEHNEDVSGDYIFHSRRCKECYDSHDLEDCSFVIHGNGARDCYDAYVLVDGAELCVDCVSIIGVHRGGYNYSVWHGNDIWYSDLCANSNNLFGCVGLTRGSNCILNKSYSKSEYQKLHLKLVEHMKETGEYGEFFPIAMSPFGYNETVAQEYFPITPEEARTKGWNWRDASDFCTQSSIGTLDDSIDEVPDDITSQTLLCSATGGPYRISAVELQFHRQSRLALPDECFEARHNRRLSLRNPRQVSETKCSTCQNRIVTAVPLDRERNILCKSCYASMVN
ncbi:hypothetical protein OAO01_05835 [Oligoflexia bacterium]|nr:hypothetical protein [Oligoflexia bacterium]